MESPRWWDRKQRGADASAVAGEDSRDHMAGAPSAEGAPEPGDALITRRIMPLRYSVKEDAGGRYLTCADAPNLIVRLERDFSVSASAARKYPECTIFLDGAAAGEPFIDAARRVYNLDHHEGCVRAFTLASCEQAMVMILKGLDLGGQSWNIYGNDPDLDTVMAVWILLNHLRLGASDSEALRRIMPVVRMQGVIDAHGFELKELAAFPEYMVDETVGVIEDLRSEELELKKAGEWATTDPLEYTLSVLQRIDEMVYSPHDFDSHGDVEEVLRVPISSDRIVLGCRSDVGIYEVEQVLRRVHGDRVGVIILDKGFGAYTLRQVDPFLPFSLNAVYDRLNQVEPSLRAAPGWGGASDIGGSPRAGGSALAPQQIADVCRWVMRPPSHGRKLAAVAATVASHLALLAALLVVVYRGMPSGRIPGLLVATGASGYGVFAILLACGAVAATLLAKRRADDFVGWRWPRSLTWIGLLPLMLVGAMAGGAWVPVGLARSAGGPSTFGWTFLVVVVVAVAGVELLIHGTTFAFLARTFDISYVGSRRILSVPNLITGMLYAGWLVVLMDPAAWLVNGGRPGFGLLAWAVAGFGTAVVCGVARERWGSLAAPVGLHLLAVALIWTVLSLVS